MVKNLRIGVLLSGGVDSAVALYTLMMEGHEVIAYHMKTMYDEFYVERQVKHKVCCSPSDTFDAQMIAKTVGSCSENSESARCFQKSRSLIII